jgi:hypothetical protein
VRKEVEPDMSFLNLFFRNLMMGENHELKNRYMIINTPQQSIEQADRTSSEQLTAPTFIANYLTPTIQNGFVTPLYPNNPKHPRQKYLLTVKGLAIFNSTK